MTTSRYSVKELRRTEFGALEWRITITKLYTYLNFGGNCEEAFRFYEQHLGGKILGIMKWSQMPDAAKHTPPGYEMLCCMRG